MANLDVLRMQTFSNNLEMLLQQRGSKFRSFCRTETAGNTKAHRFLSQIDDVNVSERTTRAEVVDNSTVDFDGRWVFWKRYHFDTIVDDIDLLQTGIQPNGMILQSAVSSLNRQIDDDFLTAFFGDAQTGETGGTTTSFDSNQVVAVTVGNGSATGMNVEKIRAGLKILREAEVDLDFEQPVVALTPKAYDDLYAFAQVTSGDFNRPGYSQINLPGLLGCQIVISNRIVPDSNGYLRCPMWVPSGMGCAVWKEIMSDIRKLPNYKGNPDLVEAEMQMGFTRLEEGRCVEIKVAA